MENSSFLAKSLTRKVLRCTLKVLENRSTFEMYLSTSTSTEDFQEMYLSTFQVLYKLYLSTDVLKYKVLLPGSGVDPIISLQSGVGPTFKVGGTCGDVNILI